MDGRSRCVTNCPTSNGDPCGGVAADWVTQFFDSSEACCNTPEFQQLNFIFYQSCCSALPPLEARLSTNSLLPITKGSGR